MKASVRWFQDAMFVGESGSGHAVVMDGAPDAGGRNLGVRPMEMLLLGLGGCTAFDVVMILKRGREPVAGCVVDMDAERAETEPKVFTRIADALSHQRPRARSEEGRARGELVRGKILLGDCDAGEDRADHARDRNRRYLSTRFRIRSTA